MLCRILFSPNSLNQSGNVQFVLTKTETAFAHSLFSASTLSTSPPISSHPALLSSLPLFSCLPFFGSGIGVAQVTQARPSKQLKTCHDCLPSQIFLSFLFPPFDPLCFSLAFGYSPFSFSLLLFIAASFYPHFCSSLSVSPSLCCTCCHIHLRAASVLWATSRKQRGKHCSN